jgi:transcription elongation factor Elf1
MPSGDAHRQWVPEMIHMLSLQWAPELSWDELVGLAGRLDATLQRIRKDRNIIPPMFTCPKCGLRKRSCFTRISVNATILAAGRFGIASQAEAKEMSRRWKQYRKEQDINHYGEKELNIAPRNPAGCN